MATTLELRVLKSRETSEAIYVNHPRKILKFLFLPKSEITQNDPSKKGGLWRVITIPDWLADEHDLG